MDSDPKVVYHGTTVVAPGPMANPPPYTQHTLPNPAPYVPPAAVIHMGVPSVIVTQPVGPQPTFMVCRSCHTEIMSKIETKPSTKTHLFALALCLLGCWCCVCIPYCTNTCRNTNHYCPNCNAYLGAYKN